jgi:hypothetical protein
MGRDLDSFLHPERISSQLICPICTLVLHNPVQTATEHLFCEDELLEWLTRSSQCPVTKRVIDPSEIRRPGRIILNMLAELEVYCKNRSRGCNWTGPCDGSDRHHRSCSFRPADELLEELKGKEAKIHELQQRVTELESENVVLTDKHSTLLQENDDLQEQLLICQQRLRVYEALVPTASLAKDENIRSTEKQSDAERLQRLQRLQSLNRK